MSDDHVKPASWNHPGGGGGGGGWDRRHPHPQRAEDRKLKIYEKYMTTKAKRGGVGVTTRLQKVLDRICSIQCCIGS